MAWASKVLKSMYSPDRIRVRRRVGTGGIRGGGCVVARTAGS